ncbi:interferon gamma receptor 2 [Archocentrus centrarchus]|uniref:interferon gamma receptor 2 n=1 Tax=Archocentrus centrarchus TaxID=63155 RepID=UPI0011E9D14C|nr:uncharacterized protein LOC115800381 [Archocentrus centrarchus]
MFRFFGVNQHAGIPATGCTMRPLLLLLCFSFSRVVSEVPLPPPHNIQVEEGQLTWHPASETVTYTVEYRRFESSKWEMLSHCVNTSASVCDVRAVTQTLRGEPPESNCVMLRVRAERKALKSEPVEACSRNGSLCTPAFSLSAVPGLLTVHLSDNHELAEEYADHAKHRVYFGKAGEKLEESKDAIASTTFEDLEEGQQYCVQVKYIVYGRLVAPPSCTQCAVIPASKHWNHTSVIAGVVAAIVALAIIIPTVGYLLLFQRQRIKRWLRLPYHIPPEFLDFPSLETPQISEPPEEPCDIIHVSPYEPR